MALVWEGRGAAAGLLYAALPLESGMTSTEGSVSRGSHSCCCAVWQCHSPPNEWNLHQWLSVPGKAKDVFCSLLSCCHCRGQSVCLTVLRKHLRAGWIQQLECMHMSRTMHSGHRIPELWCAVSSLCKPRPVQVLSRYGGFSHLVLYDRHPHKRVA